MRKFYFLIIAAMFMANSLFAQDAVIKGFVMSEKDGMPLRGANVWVVDTQKGAKTDDNGRFEISGLEAGKYQVKATYVGYDAGITDVTVGVNETVEIEFNLVESAVMSKAIQIVADRAKFRETPVAFSNIEKEEMEIKLGSRDIPMILNETPGVYATEQGGGAGDSRINIRGFDQRNVSVMINGVPVNDMENGWVYWSNWDGLGDVTSSIQVQRGLGAGKIANPSVGGTMNIVTDAADQKFGVKLKQEYGSAAFLKTSIIGNTGKIGNFAASFAGVRKTGNGIPQMTYTDAWAYYLGLSWDISKDHLIDFYLIGAPQMHGQRSYEQPIGTFNQEFAIEQGDSDAINYPSYGMLYNPHWGYIDNENNDFEPGKSYYWGSEHESRWDDRLMERQNFYHKPQMNLNWFWQINELTSLTNVFYLSIGTGGGSGHYGEYPDRDPVTGYYDYVSIYQTNTSNINPEYSATENESATILRNSANNHFWLGWLGTIDTKVSENITLQFGGDFRHYVGEHYREVRNLMGGDYVIDTRDRSKDYDLNPQLAMKRLGDKIGYHNDGIVTWLGGFFQGEYKKDALTAYLNTSLSNTMYDRYDYFRNDSWSTGRDAEDQSFIGYTVKLGANYNLTKQFNVFANAGYYSRAPFFRNVYYYDNSVYENIKNEKVLAFELGTGYWTRKLSANVNFYNTNWNDRSWYTSSYIEDEDGKKTYYNYNLPGLDAVHTGVEFDITYRPDKMLKLYAMASIGNWKWTNDVHAVFSPEDNPNITFETDVYADGLKVGDAAQTTFAGSATVYPMKGSYLNITYKHFMNHYANFDPADRGEPTDREQSWKMPSYGLLDAHAGFELPIDFVVDIEFFFHAFNLLDEVYLYDAEDGNNHNAATADVFFGLPRRYNIGIQIGF